jgi:NADH-quinone oxidoreductase subunit M
LASIGLPGTAGFVAEFLLLVSLWKACGIVLAAVAGFSLILSAAYTLRLVQKILFGASSQAVAPTEKIDLAPSAALSIAPLIFALVLFGFQPGRITNTVRLQSLIPIRLPSAQAIIVEDAAHAAGR